MNPYERTSSSPAVIVLAAGASRRFGADKRLAILGGEPLIRRSVGAALESGLRPVLVVVDPDHAAVREALAGLDVELVINPQPSRGARSSLRCGFEALPSAAPGAVVTLADMPAVAASMIAALGAALSNGAPLAVSRYGGTIAPPSGFARRLFDELSGDADDGGRSLIESHRHEATYVDWPQSRLVDVDSPADLTQPDLDGCR